MKPKSPSITPLWSVTLVLLVAVVALSGCGTVAGVGKDIQKISEWTAGKMGGSTK